MNKRQRKKYNKKIEASIDYTKTLAYQMEEVSKAFEQIGYSILDAVKGLKIFTIKFKKE